MNVQVKTSAVADVGLELLEFMHNLGEEADVQPEAKTPADFCHAIANAAGDWAGKILDAECWIDVEVGFDGKYFRSALETAIKRQEIDGFLSLHEAAELYYIADVWWQLLRHISIYNGGDQYVKKNIMKFMLALYDLKKLNAQTLTYCFIRL